MTGEEAEDVFWKCRAKLYRWANGSEWKERGLGEAKLLQHKETKKIRFLMRQEKTLKVVANHYGVYNSPPFHFLNVTPKIRCRHRICVYYYDRIVILFDYSQSLY